METSLFCENIPYFRKIFKHLTADRGSLLLKVGELICMLVFLLSHEENHTKNQSIAQTNCISLFPN